ncbi:MAG TPA: xanthine dehydrogenase family protein subunit M [Conexibacter sp.]|nr:xanthine dehydrogenase family protein subunit M [Conexibacter sp.]
MKPPRFDYARPASLDEAVALLAASEGDGKPLGGGQSLIPMLNMRFAMPATLIDLALVPELQGIARTHDGRLAIGAGVRHRAAETAPLVREACPLLAQALHHVGHVQIRNRGTVGGSLAHADPNAELPAVAVALDAELIACGPDGERAIPASEFFRGPYTTALEEDEILREVRLPALDGWRTTFQEVARRNGDFALAGVAAAVRLADDGTIAETRLACVSGGAGPTRLHAAEAALAGGASGPEACTAAGAAARAQLAADGDDDPEQDYRRALVETLVARALEEVAA